MKGVIYENSPYFSMDEVAKHNQNHDGWFLDSSEMAKNFPVKTKLKSISH